MRKLNGFICVSALAMLCSAANAQMRVVIDNQTIPTEHIESIVILKNTNEINIATTVAYDVGPAVVGDGVAITAFTVSPGTILAGGSTTLSWATENAVACTASDGVGGWAGSAISLPSGNTQISTSTIGSHTFTLTCDGSEPGDTATRGVVLNVNPADAVTISSFDASPLTITEGGSTTLSWTTQNAVACTPSGGTGGWSALNIALPSGSTPITIAVAGTYTFTLTCQGPSADETVANRTVTVDPDIASCDTPPLSGSTTYWETFWKSEFPEPRNNIESLSILRYGYKALRFHTGDVVDSGAIYALENTTTTGLITGAFSECPGDFDVPSECYSKYRLGGSLTWVTDGGYGCQLQPNTTYYFNFTFTDGFNPAVSKCGAIPCVATIQHKNY